MALITPEETGYFKSASYIFSKIKRDLSSFDSAGMIDEGEFPTYVKHVMRLIGIGVYEEKQAVMAVKNYKAKLPPDFAQLYAAYKCTPYVATNDIAHLQGKPISVYNDVTWELLHGGSNCDIETMQTQNTDARVFEKITVRQYVKETPVVVNFKNPILLSLSPNVQRELCGEDCQNLLSTEMHEISIRDGQLYTNFTSDSIYMKYYAFPVDEEGVPKILDNERFEKAVEWYIKCELMKNWWYNNSVPDLQNRWQAAEIEYEKWLAECRKERKMPWFSQMVNDVRKKRSINKIVLFSK